MLQFATGHIIITPQEALPLAGFPNRTGNYAAVADDIEINLVVIKEHNKYYLLYAVDTFIVPAVFEAHIATVFGAELGIDHSNIWIGASHTHFAPSLDAATPLLGACDQGYVSFVKEKMTELTRQVLGSGLKDGYIAHTSGEAPLNINRRKRLLRRKDDGSIGMKTLLLPNYDGASDPSLHLLKFCSGNGAILAYFWNYACHPVHALNRQNLSSDYIGYVRNKIRRQENNAALPIVFFQGFAGNLRADVSTVTHTRFTDRVRYFFQLLPKYVNFPTAEHYTEWCGLLWQKIHELLKAETKTTVRSGLSSAIVQQPLKDYIGEQPADMLNVKKLDLGDNISLVGINAEVVTEYSTIVKQMLAEKTVINIGYLAGTRTYLPTDAMLKEKGYEVDGFRKLFGISGTFKPSLEEKIKNAIAALS